jgi:hypothetical protein
MMYICILLQMLESSVSLLITMKPTTQENFRLVAILLYYILQKYRLNGSWVFPQILSSYFISGSIVALISPVYVFSLLLLTVSIYNSDGNLRPA